MNQLAPAKNKILFANFPGDGHFNPLTGLAVHLVSLGYDVRWYTSKGFAPKLKKLQIPHYPFVKAIDVSDGNFDDVFPGRKKLNSAVSKLKFDIVHAFVLRGPEYYQDLCEVYREFPFDLVIADCAFTGIPFIKDSMGIPVIAVGVFPLTASSVDLPPVGLGMEPSYSIAGKIKQALLRTFVNRVLFKAPNKVMHRMLDEHGIHHKEETVFDLLLSKCDVLLQSGTPSFEYQRRDMPAHVHFAGPMLPHSTASGTRQWFDERLNRFKKVIVVTQGTVEKDINKLLVPTLEAFKDSDTLVVCTTGGSQTAALRQRYSQRNIIIEDFIPFNDIMPYADAYITNGGFGGVLLGIENNLPLVVAGVHEGKNEICARVGYFKLGINLKTEKPLPRQLMAAVEEVINNPIYKENVVALAEEFKQYQPNDLCAAQVASLLKQSTGPVVRAAVVAEKVY
ncbi:MAG TPA: nucleotide disphospho-sugar-binding domain-containing protein [Chitinophagaceae bacterium]|nr:nucleotide disphospho-sugar-binding domain-containing protein [Chitinophagaceae bacterium]